MLTNFYGTAKFHDILKHFQPYIDICLLF